MGVIESAPQGTSRLDLTVTVASQVDSGIALTADFPSLNGGPTDTFSYTLTLTNNTPAQQTFNFTGSGPEGWTVTASPAAESRANTVTVDGGGTSQIKVSATPPANIASGKYQIEVDVTGANGATGKISLGAEVSGVGAARRGDDRRAAQPLRPLQPHQPRDARREQHRHRARSRRSASAPRRRADGR